MKKSNPEGKYANRLINETSPYLLQHAHNPVDWYPWNEEALEKAKLTDKPILVSIGYSACHWCHVMERESFENEAVAALMNNNFINIKIDREERPDLDNIYMDAVQAMTGSGGWPLNVFLTPDAKPFYGGTYFPPVKAFNRTSWTDVLVGISQAWKDRKNEIESQAENLLDHIRKAGNIPVQKIYSNKDDILTDYDFKDCDAAFVNIMKNADEKWGGFGKAPKFPQTFTIGYLLQYYHFSKNNQALSQALLSIDKMLEGGIYDHIGGGLARYSTDEEWLAPHFEKMLYDNALLITILCDACQVTKQTKYAVAIDKTISFVLEELYHPLGGFYAAMDADSEGEEGKYYVWQKEEIDNLLKQDAGLFCSFFDVSEKGNWDGKNILRILEPAEKFAAQNGLEIEVFHNLMDSCLKKLNFFRKNRVKPHLDDKVILGWNALMLKAITNASIVLKNEKYLAIAIRNFQFLMENFKQAPNSIGLKHTWKNGVAKYPAFLDDYAYFIEAAIKLYEATLDESYLTAAQLQCKYVVENFSDEADVFFYFTNQSQQDIIVRKKEMHDGAIPSGNAVMAGNLLYLSVVFDIDTWRQRANLMLLTLTPAIIKHPGSFGVWAVKFMQQLIGANEVTIIGENYKMVAEEIQSYFFIPNKILIAAPAPQSQIPLLTGKTQGKPVHIYLCKNYTCKEPVTDIEAFMNILNEEDKLMIDKNTIKNI
jgi:uncharacterized protein YyaL (SSP411 family)